MTSSVRLDIRGFAGEAVPNQFIKQESEADRLAILLPGMGYSCDMPLFYYAQNVLEERGADVLRVEYAYGLDRMFRVARLRTNAAGCSRTPARRIAPDSISVGTGSSRSLANQSARSRWVACLAKQRARTPTSAPFG